MGKVKDLTGQKFNMLTVIGRSNDREKEIKQRTAIWTCLCECGNIVDVSRIALRDGQVSCGCYRIKNIKGQKFGRLTAIKVTGFKRYGEHGRAIWLCQCDCGNTVEVVSESLIQEATKSCGCYKSEKTSERLKIDLVGQRFDRLTVIIQVEHKGKEIQWLCKCDCGNEIKVTTSSLRHGHTTSCGCKNRERLSSWVGEKHPNWKGGFKNLNRYIRYVLEDWKKESLYASNYKCLITGSNKNIEIHHLYPFHLILKEALDFYGLGDIDCADLSESELISIKEKCIEINNQYGLGVCLTKDVHNEFHKKYSKIDFTPEDFQEFFYIKTGKVFDLDSLKVGDLINAI